MACGTGAQCKIVKCFVTRNKNDVWTPLIRFERLRAKVAFAFNSIYTRAWANLHVMRIDNVKLVIILAKLGSRIRWQFMNHFCVSWKWNGSKDVLVKITRHSLRHRLGKWIMRRRCLQKQHQFVAISLEIFVALVKYFRVVLIDINCI